MYDTQATPRPRNFVSGYNSRFYFYAGNNLNPAAVPAGIGWLDLGDCTASQQKSGMKASAVTRARNGIVSRVSNNVTTLEPELDITVNEIRAVKLIPTLIFGTQNQDILQAAATGATVTFNGVSGDMAYSLGKHVVLNVVVNVGTAGGALAVENRDYQVHAPSGTITIIPVANGGTIPESTANTPSNIVVTFDCKATTRTSFTEYTQPNRNGLLKWFEEDTYSDDGVATVKVAYVNLMGGDPGSNDPTKSRADKLTASILGQVVRSDRKD